MRIRFSCICVLLAVLLGASCHAAQGADAPPILQDIAFRGLEHASPEMLEEIAHVVPKTQIGLPYDEAAMQTEKTALLALGWYANVDTSIEQLEGGIRLVFIVKENPTVLVVTVDGLKNLTEQEQQMATDPAKALQNLPLNSKTVEAVKGQIQQLGWFLTCACASKPVKDGVLLQYTVTEAPVINAVVFEGNTQMSNDDLAKIVCVHPGAVLNHDLLLQAAKSIESAYAKKGYTQTRVTDEKVADDNSLHFSICETVINKITIEGNDQTPLETIQGALTFKVGDVYNVNIISDSVRKLNALGLFTEVQAIAEPGKDQGTVEEKIVVQEKPKPKTDDATTPPV